MVYDLNPKNPIFRVFWGINPKMRFFHEKFQKSPVRRFGEAVLTIFLRTFLQHSFKDSFKEALSLAVDNAFSQIQPTHSVEQFSP